MITFESQFFQPLKFSKAQLEQYLNSAFRDLEIAESADIPEVRFKFAYEALIKMGIALIAQNGYKVRSQPGHHIRIIEKLSELLNDPDALLLGNKMRQDRNADFYDGGILLTDKTSSEYLDFVRRMISKIKTSP